MWDGIVGVFVSIEFENCIRSKIVFDLDFTGDLEYLQHRSANGRVRLKPWVSRPRGLLLADFPEEK
jgi:hypothetical protein